MTDPSLSSTVAPRTQAVQSNVGADHDATGTTALVVEDDAALLNLLHETLVDAGFETTAVDRGVDAMNLLKQHPFDVLVADVNLPDMSGMIVCDQARAWYQGQIVIMVITGERIQTRLVAALQLCADSFLGKPFDVEELVTRIENTLLRRPAA